MGYIFVRFGCSVGFAYHASAEPLCLTHKLQVNLQASRSYDELPGAVDLVLWRCMSREGFVWITLSWSKPPPASHL